MDDVRRRSLVRRDLIEAVTGRLGPRAQLVRIEGADHGYKVPKTAGLTAATVEALLVAETERFLASLGF